MIRALQIVDTLDAGGMERMAIAIANSLPTDEYESHICLTRRGGILEQELAKHVHRLDLNRSSRYDLPAFYTLARYIKDQRIQIVHAHGPSLFLGSLIHKFDRSFALVWHDHFGAGHLRRRPLWPYRLAAHGAERIIVVTADLEQWAIQKLHRPAESVRYIPNFVVAGVRVGRPPDLPGVPGKRLVCVANFKPAKDHMTLIRAMSQVVQVVRDVHLLLIGDSTTETADQVRAEIDHHSLTQHVTLLGVRDDVYEILRASNIGILSSVSEGLPVALIEYGLMNLPAVATDVGQCAEVLEGGAAGILVPPRNSVAIAEAVTHLLSHPAEARALAERLHLRVSGKYGVRAGMSSIGSLYNELVGRNP